MEMAAACDSWGNANNSVDTTNMANDVQQKSICGDIELRYLNANPGILTDLDGNTTISLGWANLDRSIIEIIHDYKGLGGEYMILYRGHFI